MESVICAVVVAVAVIVYLLCRHEEKKLEAKWRDYYDL